MALLSKMAAAKAAGISRPTLYRHIKQGKVSVVIDDDGNQCVDESEIFRVYGKLETTKKDDVTENDVTETEPELRNITVQKPDQENVELLKYKVEVLEKQLEEEKARSKQLLDIVENQTLTLPKPSTKPSRGFIGRLFGKD